MFKNLKERIFYQDCIFTGNRAIKHIDDDDVCIADSLDYNFEEEYLKFDKVLLKFIQKHSGIEACKKVLSSSEYTPKEYNCSFNNHLMFTSMMILVNYILIYKINMFDFKRNVRSIFNEVGHDIGQEARDYNLKEDDNLVYYTYPDFFRMIVCN